MTVEHAVLCQRSPGFAFVDEAPDLEDLIEFLDIASAVPTVRAYKEASFAALELAPGGRVLDVGCGNGDDLLQLAERIGPDGTAVGVDPSSAVLERARTRSARFGSRVQLHVGS